MMYSLGAENWWRLLVWLAVGLTVYFGYSRYHSRRQLETAGFARQATSASFAGDKPKKP